jgi:SAM-dependent methyltransferase
MAANRANWDARTPIHVRSRFYGVDGSRSPEVWFAPFEWDDLGDLRGRSVLHLQCHLGTETVAFARRGARATGLDFSPAAVAQARRLAARRGDAVEYVEANVYDAREALPGRRFDLVYTGKGALCYLPDLARWAEIVAGLLNPGGRLYLVEFHPVLQSLGPKPGQDDGPELLLRHDYLEGRGALERDATYTYTDGPALDTGTTAYEWAHGLGEVITALSGAGLRTTALRETDHIPWPRWPGMVQDGHGWWHFPPDRPRIPLFYALTATP